MKEGAIERYVGDLGYVLDWRSMDEPFDRRGVAVFLRLEL
jgi:hypothetical protein